MSSSSVKPQSEPKSELQSEPFSFTDNRIVPHQFADCFMDKRARTGSAQVGSEWSKSNFMKNKRSTPSKKRRRVGPAPDEIVDLTHGIPQKRETIQQKKKETADPQDSPPNKVNRGVYEKELNRRSIENAELRRDIKLLRAKVVQLQTLRAEDSKFNEAAEAQLNEEIEDLNKKLHIIGPLQQRITELQSEQKDSLCLPDTHNVQDHQQLVHHSTGALQWFNKAIEEMHSRVQRTESFAQENAKLAEENQVLKRELRTKDREISTRLMCGMCVEDVRSVMFNCKGHWHLFYCESCWAKQVALDLAEGKQSTCPKCRTKVTTDYSIKL